MLEVVFSDSEKGSMRLAKSYDAEKMKGGAVGYIFRSSPNSVIAHDSNEMKIQLGESL
jgi:hypothetical protein